MEGPGQVVGDLDPDKLDALDHFNFIPLFRQGHVLHSAS